MKSNRPIFVMKVKVWYLKLTSLNSFFYLMCLAADLLGDKEMATHSSTLAWRILWTEKHGGLPSMGSHRVGHGWSDLACMHALEKKMASHSSTLAWRILWTEEPGGLGSMGTHRVGHDWSNLAAAAAADVLSCGCLFVACQVPLTVEFSRQEYWSGLPFPSPHVP